MTWPGTQDHQALLRTATRLVSDLLGIDGRLIHLNDTTHWQHQEFAGRAHNLGVYLRAALRQTSEDEYAPAFASVRVALEHMLLDQLIFNGQRLIQSVRGVDNATWAEWQRQHTAGEGFANVIEWTRYAKKNTVEIITEGLRSTPDDDGTTYLLSPYYFLLQQFEPFFGPASVQHEFDDGISEVEDFRRIAKEYEQYYLTYLSWSSIKRNLRLNGFADETTFGRIDVHYRFLSAFVHPTTNTNEIIYGRNNPNVPRYDHYSSELALLYVIVVAVEELRHFHQMSQRPPLVGIDGWDDLDALCDTAWSLTSHLWWPGQPPHALDRIQEAHKRRFRALRDSSTAQGPIPSPDAIPEQEIRYYRDPIRRLVRLHGSFQEIMTGLAYQSPWPRTDAQFR